MNWTTILSEIAIAIIETLADQATQALRKKTIPKIDWRHTRNPFKIPASLPDIEIHRKSSHHSLIHH